LIFPAATPKDFPGLADIENIVPFPEISINLIQEVATSRCGLSPLEVTSELLLASHEDQATQVNGGSSSPVPEVNNE
jgi:hypothetical protein